MFLWNIFDDEGHILGRKFSFRLHFLFGTQTKKMSFEKGCNCGVENQLGRPQAVCAAPF